MVKKSLLSVPCLVYIVLICISCTRTSNFPFSCENKHENLDLKDFSNSTNQLLFIDNKIVLVKKPQFEGECCFVIQLINKDLKIIDSIPIIPYPILKIEHHQLHIIFNISKTSEDRYIQFYNTYKNMTLGSYKIQIDKQIVNSYNIPEILFFDSISYIKPKVKFYVRRKLLLLTNVEELFYGDNYFIYVNLEGVDKTPVHLKTNNDFIYNEFFRDLIRKDLN